MSTEVGIDAFSDLANKIESKLKLHRDLEVDFRFVMNPDAAAAFVDMLRKTRELVELTASLRAERDDVARDMRGRCVNKVEKLYGLNPKIHPVQIMRELQDLALMSTERADG